MFEKVSCYTVEPAAGDPWPSLDFPVGWGVTADGRWTRSVLSQREGHEPLTHLGY